MTLTNAIAMMALAVSLAGPRAPAQTPQAPPDVPGASSKQTSNGAAEMKAQMTQLRIQTFYLSNVSQKPEANEILIALRNMLPPYVKLYLVTGQDAIVIEAAPDQLASAQKLIDSLDRPHKTYRLTYTITDVDGGKQVGTQHFSMVVVTGQETVLKQGSKVPVLTGSYNPDSSSTAAPGVQTQFTYLDIGMNFSATLDEMPHGARLRSKVEQSSIAEEKSGAVAQDPIVRQTVLEGTSFLTLDKPLILGSLDIFGSTRRLDVSVVMEQVK